jgi:hypothetical protein
MWSDWLVWAALAVSALAIVPAVMLVRRGLELLRTARASAAALADALDRLATSVETASQRSEDLADHGVRLEQSLDRLATSRARLAVLQAALADVSAAVGRVRSVYPSRG